MSIGGPFDGNQELASEVLRKVGPDFSWVYEYFEGALVVSRLACESYGLKPRAEVKFPEEVDLANRREVIDGLPRLHLTVVGPDEMQKIIDIMAGQEDAQSVASNQAVFGKEGGRLDIIMGFAATLGSDPEEQEAFFEGIYGDEWPAVQQRNNSDDFAYRMSHLIPDSIPAALAELLPEYRQSKKLNTPPALIGRYAASVSGSVHEVLCNEEHIPHDAGIPDGM